MAIWIRFLLDRDEMINKVRNYIQQHQLITSNDRILLALSGGADSVCLFYVFLQLQVHLNFEFHCLHVNHSIRQEEALRDELFVRELCRSYQIPFHFVKLNIPSIAKERKQSMEETGRELRRQYLLQVAHEHQYNKIAMAHHQDDAVETFIMNLARGTGIDGLCGIQNRTRIQGSEIELIRPLLSTDKCEIYSWLEQHHYAHCEDSSNQENDYTRNVIRNEILPSMQSMVNEQASSHIISVMQDIQEARFYLEQQLNSAYEDVVCEKPSYDCIETSASRDLIQGLKSKRTASGSHGSYRNDGQQLRVVKDRYLDVAKLQQYDPYIQKAICKKVLVEVASQSRDIGRVHIHNLYELIDKNTGSRIDLPYHMTAHRDARRIYIAQYEYRADQASSSLDMRHISQKQYEEYDKDLTFTKCIDYDIMKVGLILRTRQPGDYITINHHGEKQSLNRYFINAKIPARVRDHIPVVADGSEIVWVVGYRLNQKYHISEKTEHILQMNYSEVNNGREY